VFLLLSGIAMADWELSGKAGLTYDYISNNYYLRTVDTLGLTPDSLLELRSISDRIDESGGFIRLDLDKPGPLQLQLSNRLYFTDEKIRAVFNVDGGWRGLSLSSFTDFKSYSSSEDFSIYQRRFRNSSRLSFDLLKDSSRSLQLSQEFEYVGYDDDSDLISSYQQSETRLRLRQQTGKFSDFSLAGRIDLRDYRDTSKFDFTRLSGDLGFTHVGSRSYLDTRLYLERTDYDAPDSEDDYLYLAPTLRWDRAISGPVNLAPNVELHYYRYDRESYVTFSHLLLESDLLLEYDYQLLSTISFGLGIDIFSAAEDDYSDQDYSSWQLLAGYETYSSGWLTLSCDGEFGRRNYVPSEEEFYTDYQFVRLDLLADFVLTRSLRLSLLGGIDFEYHAEKEDDIVLHLLSATLTYQLK
jgi:hypothetical protein